jgi:UDP-GlcNAc3NAcA epimerase
MKILTTIGARPQFIKAATVSRELRKTSVREVIVHTGQHHDANMSDIFFEEMDIPQPNYQLGIKDLGHGAMTGRMLEKLEEVLKIEKPDVALVYGDTNSTLAGALAAAKLHIPVAHVEAGLRSFNMDMPEEINRILTDRISKYLFCPTAVAVDNLAKEGYNSFDCEINKSGDVMFDSVLYYWSTAAQSNIIAHQKLRKGNYILVTLHRAENTNDPKRLSAICNALNDICRRVPVVMPLHPRTKAYLKSNNIPLDAHVIDPVGYFDMLALLEGCGLVMTDSGGLQKESYFFGKYCITLRDQTEWTELVDAGVNALAGASSEKIIQLFGQYFGKTINTSGSLYGDGKAAQKIVARLVSI